jgi:uncharacterized protein (UPF0332 family)
MRTPQILTDEKRKILVELRLEKAHQAKSDALFALQSGRLLMSVNRIYYAMFYATSALALLDGFSTSKHKQLHGWFHQHYISTGVLDKRLYRILIEGFEQRSDGDYEDRATFTAEEVQMLFENMNEYIAALETLIHTRTSP